MVCCCVNRKKGFDYDHQTLKKRIVSGQERVRRGFDHLFP